MKEFEAKARRAADPDKMVVADFVKGAKWAYAESVATMREQRKVNDALVQYGLTQKDEVERLREELERAKGEINRLESIYQCQLPVMVELKLLVESDRAKIAKLEKERDCYAQAMAVALHDGVFVRKAETNAAIEQILAALGGGET